MANVTFPQPGDLPDAAYFAFANGRGKTGIISGLTLSPDGSFADVTVDSGKAVIDRGEMTTVHPNIEPADTISDAAVIVEIESQTVSLTPGSVNHVFLDANVGEDDQGTVVTNITGSKPTAESVKIGEVDTINNTVSEQWNLITEDGTLSYPDADAATTALQSLPTGVTTIDRDTGTQITDAELDIPSLTVDSISGSSLTDQITDTQLDTSSGFFDLGSNDLRLATGQSIEDGSGTKRIKFNDGGTNLYSDTGSVGIQLLGSGLNNRVGTDGYNLRDLEGGFKAIQYNTSASAPGTLELTRAKLNLNGNVIYGVPKLAFGTSGGEDANLDNRSWKLWRSQGYDNSSNVNFTMGSSRPRNVDNGIIHRYEWHVGGDARAHNLSLRAVETERGSGVGVDNDEGQTVDKLYIDGGGVNGYVGIRNSNLRIDTERAITDGSGVDRMRLRGPATELVDDISRKGIQLSSNVDNRIIAYHDQPIRFKDNEGGFYALRYDTSASSPGKISLNANVLQTAGGTIQFDSVSTPPTGGGYNNSNNTVSWQGQGGGNGVMGITGNSDGEIHVFDDAGNATTLT